MKNKIFALLFADETGFWPKTVVLAVGLALTICVLVAINGFHGVNLSMPIAYSGDALESLRTVKDIINGDAAERLCAPFGHSLKENYFWKIVHLFFYPSIVLIIKIIGWFTVDPVKALNFYYLTTYFLTSFAFIYVAMQLRFPSVLAIPLGLLYAFLPYHYLRGVSHLYPMSYYSVPLICLILIWIWRLDPPFFQKRNRGYRLILFNYKGVFSVLVLFFVLPTHYYFNFFGLYLALVSGVSAALYRKNLVYLVSGILVAGLMLGSIYKGELYISIYSLFNKEACSKYVEGKALSKRGQPITSPGDVESYSLKPVQLVLPVIKHRIEALRDLTEFYLKTNRVNENKSASLGFMGSIGLIYLLFGLLCVKREKNLLYEQLTILNIFIILLGTVGGLSSLISTFAGYFLTPESLICQARSYNRVSVFVGFFSLLALGIPLKRFFNKIVSFDSKTKHFRISGVLSALAISCVILIVGIFDQVNPAATFYADSCIFPQYKQDRDFVAKIEKELGEGAQIFQLPFVIHHPSAGSGYVNQMFYSDHLVGYLNSDKLKWSYEGDSKTFQTSFYKYAAMSSEEKMLQALYLYDFDGIWIDRNGFTDSGKQIEHNLESIIGYAPLISDNGRYAFFDIGDGKRNFLSSHSSGRIKELKRGLDQEIARSIMMTKRRGLLQHEKEILAHGKVNIPMTNKTPREIGVISTLVDGTKAMFCKAGQIGCMVYGPYWQLPPGKYRVKFFLRANKSDGDEAGKVEISIFDKSTKSVSKVAEKKITGDTLQDWQETSINFEVEKDVETDLYEFKVYSNGRWELFVRDIELEKLS